MLENLSVDIYVLDSSIMFGMSFNKPDACEIFLGIVAIVIDWGEEGEDA